MQSCCIVQQIAGEGKNEKDFWRWVWHKSSAYFINLFSLHQLSALSCNGSFTVVSLWFCSKTLLWANWQPEIRQSWKWKTKLNKGSHETSFMSFLHFSKSCRNNDLQNGVLGKRQKSEHFHYSYLAKPLSFIVHTYSALRINLSDDKIASAASCTEPTPLCSFLWQTMSNKGNHNSFGLSSDWWTRALL